jgi:hypothetical protein
MRLNAGVSVGASRRIVPLDECSVERPRRQVDASGMAPRGRLALVTVAAVLFVCVGTALAAAPGVLYQDPTNVTQSGAVLQGSINPSDKTTTYYFEYGTSTGYGAVTTQATLPKSKAWQAVSAAITGLSAGSTYHYRIVAWNGGGTKDKTVGPDHTFTTAPPPSAPGDPSSSPGDAPPDVSGGGGTQPDQSDEASPADGLRPTLGASVVVHAVAGRVLVQRPRSGGFVRLATGAEVPLESVIDASHGRIALTSALPSGRTQTGRFGGGRFQLRQGRRGYVDLYLRGRTCRTSGRHAHVGSASAASARTRRRNHLWGHDRGGRFRTHGRNSQATVRGTHWLVADRCDGTLTFVTKGSVVVRDTVTHKRLVLHAGERYLARDR